MHSDSESTFGCVSSRGKNELCHHSGTLTVHFHMRRSSENRIQDKVRLQWEFRFARFKSSFCILRETEMIYQMQHEKWTSASRFLSRKLRPFF